MMKSYIISIVIAAIISSVAGILLPPKTTVGQISKLLCGVLLTVTVISPLTKLSFRHIGDYLTGLTSTADEYIYEGCSAMQKDIDSIIKAKAEAYILDKASELGLQVNVEVSLDENNHSIPCEVTIIGIFSPYSRENLGAYIENTLGIVKEKQKWISKG